MTRSECDSFLEDPEGHAAHAASCDSCGALRKDLDRIDAVLGESGIDSAPAGNFAVRPPLAPWEGANDRAWAFVILSGTLLLFAAAVFFMLSGITPLRGFAEAVSQVMFPRVNVVSLGTSWARTLQRAPVGIHLILGLCFVAVNVLFVLLLRRQPRGIHVSSR